MPKPYAQIILPLKVDKPFTYSIPPALRDRVRVGSRALVPLGRRTTTGIVVELLKKSPFTQVKDILDLPDAGPVFDPATVALTRWMADYYLCTWNDALRAALPAELRRKSKRLIRLKEPYAGALAKKLRSSSRIQARIVQLLGQHGELSDAALARRLAREGLLAALHQLQNAGHVEIREEEAKPSVGVRTEAMVRLLVSPEEVGKTIPGMRKRAPRGAAGLETLAEMGGTARLAGLLEKATISWETVRRLQEKGLVEIFQRESPREAYRELGREAPPQHTLTGDQRKALKRVEQSLQAKEFHVFLIHGVTGSGKTEVYIRSIRRAMKLGRGTIILVPEISLTPQTVSRFRAHFGDQVAVFHSGLSAGERYDAWRRTQDGRCRIVVGARSAVFAPLPDLGLIIVDEEHVDSYKQTEAQPRYHARDVAIMRAKLSGALVLLGSATPSLESYHNVELKKFSLCSLPNRIDELPMPSIQIVDMCQEKKEDNWGIFSRILQEKIAHRLEKGEQIILFLNRRGFSTCIRCQECGFVMSCPHCNVTLTYHAHDLTIKCHYCGFRQKAPHDCPSCGGSHIKFRGTGTQRVEQEVRELFTRAGILRMDRDTTARRGAHVRILERFRQGRADILLGTQMIAKGLDFPRVTLVGVVSADGGLNLPDFRSTERTFQLITQVAGRAGRSAPGGEVLVQTHSPEEIAIRLSRDHDYPEFARHELASRKALGYPPFGKVILLILQATEEVRVTSAAEKLAGLLRDDARRMQLGQVQILGPAPAPLSKLRGQYRWQILLKAPGSAALHKLMRKIISRGSRWPPWPGVRVRVVVDPVEML